MTEFFSTSRLILFALLTVMITAGSALAHGKEKQPEKTKMDLHMQAMMAVKKDVSEEYRVMERTPVVPDEQSLAPDQPHPVSAAEVKARGSFFRRDILEKLNNLELVI